MKRMFTSATLKLTGWYLLILIVISLLFSFIIYELSTSEISSRLERLQVRLEGNSQTITLPGPLTLTDLRMNQTQEAKTSIFVGLVYMNVAVIGIGGVGAYLFARRTLRPIEEAHESQSRFTSYASHELRTPLAVMQSEIQVMLREPSVSSSEYKELLKSNLEEVEKLTKLSESLLQLSRLDYENLTSTDRIDVIKAAKASAKRLKIDPKRLVYNLPKQPSVFIDGSKSMIEDLLHILLDNALKYSPLDSIIDITISTNGRTCKIKITNWGAGISKKDIDKIFERFYRGESTKDHQSSGYGLGLSLAKKIVNIHDGAISVSSTAGKSTTFTISLPQVKKNR